MARPGVKARLVGLIVFLLTIPIAANLSGQTRHARRLGIEHGLVPAYVTSLAQDTEDFLWIGTAGGLYRFDGVEMRRWAPETLRSWVSAVSVGPDGAIVVLDEDGGRVFDIVPEGARALRGPDPRQEPDRC